MVRTSYPSLLRSAGFVDIDVSDLTREYRDTQQAWLVATDEWREELIDLVGIDEYTEAHRRRRSTLESIDTGLLARRLYLARRP